VSVGLACTFPTPPDSASALLNLADAALYQAKARGRNRVVVTVDGVQREITSKTDSNGYSFGR
jgi:predicted signal transduction protein with EAL and GGDEF domain